MGIWVHITQPGTTVFDMKGVAPIVIQQITLSPGWNLVGYPSTSDKDRTSALNNIIFDTHVNAIWTYDAATQKWMEIGPSDNLEVGRGYWMHCISANPVVWDVPL